MYLIQISLWISVFAKNCRFLKKFSSTVDLSHLKKTSAFLKQLKHIFKVFLSTTLFNGSLSLVKTNSVTVKEERKKGQQKKTNQWRHSMTNLKVVQQTDDQGTPFWITDYSEQNRKCFHLFNCLNSGRRKKSYVSFDSQLSIKIHLHKLQRWMKGNQLISDIRIVHCTRKRRCGNPLLFMFKIKWVNLKRNCILRYSMSLIRLFVWFSSETSPIQLS